MVSTTTATRFCQLFWGVKLQPVGSELMLFGRFAILTGPEQVNDWSFYLYMLMANGYCKVL